MIESLHPSSRGPAAALLLLALTGCAGGEDLTTRSLREARRTWDRAGIRDYDLEWTSRGARDGHYAVRVRRGHVEKIDMIVTDPDTGETRAIEAHPGQPGLYGIDGLFQILEEELDQSLSDEPFGQPRGTRAVLKFTPDPKLGYPRHFVRDVSGGGSLRIDVLGLDPLAPADAPAPAATKGRDPRPSMALHPAFEDLRARAG